MAATAPAPAIEVPPSEQLMLRIKERQPLLAANPVQGEQDRRVAEESIVALTGADVFKVAQPRRYGGYETSMRTMLDVSSAVGEADGGTARVVTLCNVCACLTELFSEP